MKNLKVLLGIVLALSLVLAVGCSHEVTDTTNPEGSSIDEVDSTSELTVDPVTGTPIDESDAVEIETEIETDETESAETGLEMFAISEEAASSQTVSTCLVRDDSLYVLSGTVTGDLSSWSFDAGRDIVYDGQPGRILYDKHDESSACSIGSVEPPVIHRDDLVIGYSSFGVPRLDLVEVEFCGYGVYSVGDMVNSTLNFYTSFDPESYVSIPKQFKDTIQILDAKGNPVEDPHNLDYGETYLVSWYEGTQYYEVETEATSSYYVITNGTWGHLDYSIEGELTREGYVIYDLSELPSGTYSIAGDGSVFVLE